MLGLYRRSKRLFVSNTYTQHIENAFLPLRVVVVIVAGIVIATMSALPLSLWYLVICAALYNLVTLLLIRLDNVSNAVSYVSPLVNGSLAVGGLLLSGGLDSPLQPGLTLVLVAAALRQPPGWSAGTAVMLLSGFAFGELYLPNLHGLVNVGRLTVFCTFNLLLVVMVGAHRKADRAVQVQLLQVAAHELRNPMAGLKGLISLLSRRLASKGYSEDSARMLLAAGSELDRVGKLVTELVDAYCAQQGRLLAKREVLDFAEVVKAALEPFVAANSDEIITLAIEPGGFPILGDENRLKELVSNLVDNALKYSPPESKVQVSVTRTERCWTTLTVADNGVGIPKNQLPKVFDRFYRVKHQTDRDPGGMGLGLYICREIVRQHSGRIRVESELGHGTVFRISLPLQTGS